MATIFCLQCSFGHFLVLACFLLKALEHYVEREILSSFR